MKKSVALILALIFIIVSICLVSSVYASPIDDLISVSGLVSINDIVSWIQNFLRITGYATSTCSSQGGVCVWSPAECSATCGAQSSECSSASDCDTCCCVCYTPTTTTTSTTTTTTTTTTSTTTTTTTTSTTTTTTIPNCPSGRCAQAGQKCYCGSTKCYAGQYCCEALNVCYNTPDYCDANCPTTTTTSTTTTSTTTQPTTCGDAGGVCLASSGECNANCEAAGKYGECTASAYDCDVCCCVCTSEIPTPVCGDGNVSSGEDCDPPANNSAQCLQSTSTCDYTNRAYCTRDSYGNCNSNCKCINDIWNCGTADDFDYCDNCYHCGDNVCNCNETVESCPYDCEEVVPKPCPGTCFPSPTECGASCAGGYCTASAYDCDVCCCECPGPTEEEKLCDNAIPLLSEGIESSSSACYKIVVPVAVGVRDIVSLTSSGKINMYVRWDGEYPSKTDFDCYRSVEAGEDATCTSPWIIRAYMSYYVLVDVTSGSYKLEYFREVTSADTCALATGYCSGISECIATCEAEGKAYNCTPTYECDYCCCRCYVPPEDTKPPVISNIEISPSEPTNIDEITIKATATDELSNIGLCQIAFPTVVVGTATSTVGVQHGDYTIYSDLGSADSWARVIVKDSAGVTVDTDTINQGDMKIMSSSNLLIRVIKVSALENGTVIGTTLSVIEKDEHLYQDMVASDGLYDSKTEEVEKNIGKFEFASMYTVFIRCSDDSGNWGDSKNYTFEVKAAVPLVTQKDLSKYTKKMVFLISDENWRDVLSLVPVAVWTNKDGSVSKYPLLIYHEEDLGFDADSIIYFMQQYSPISKLIVVGDTPQELDNLLITEPEFGAGLKENKIIRIYPKEYLSYWSSIGTLVVVDYDNYEAGLMGSVFASYINAPILFIDRNNLNEYKELIDGRKVYRIGITDFDVTDYINKNAREMISYSLSELQEEYVKLTNTDKIILTNPNDLNIKVIEEFIPEKSTNPVSELYSKTSLTAPILASAKHEIIISTKSTNYKIIDKFIEDETRSLKSYTNFLTIMASPNSIPMAGDRPCDTCGRPSLDLLCYGNLHGCTSWGCKEQSDVAVGRIFGISISDVSSYVARDLYYDILEKNLNNIFLYASMYDKEDFEPDIIALSKALKSLGYETTVRIEPEPSELIGRGIIVYHNHGSPNWAGINSEQIPFMSNSFMLVSACLTCSFDEIFKKQDLFCSNAIRKGSIGFVGAVDITWGLGNWKRAIGPMLTYEKPIGETLDVCSNYVYIGDPTLTIIMPHKLGKLSQLEINKKEVFDGNEKVSFTFSTIGGNFIVEPEEFERTFLGWPYFGAATYQRGSESCYPLPIVVDGNFEGPDEGVEEVKILDGKTKISTKPYKCQSENKFDICQIRFKLNKYAPDLFISDVDYEIVGENIIYKVSIGNKGGIKGTIYSVQLNEIPDVNKNGIVGSCNGYDEEDWKNSRAGYKYNLYTEVEPNTIFIVEFSFPYKYKGEIRCLNAAVNQWGEDLAKESSRRNNVLYKLITPVSG